VERRPDQLPVDEGEYMLMIWLEKTKFQPQTLPLLEHPSKIPSPEMPPEVPPILAVAENLKR